MPNSHRNCFQTKRKALIVIAFLLSLYWLYVSSDSWLISKSVSNSENDAKNVVNRAKSLNWNSLPNLMHRQFVVNSSYISAQRLDSLIKGSSTQVLIATAIDRSFPDSDQSYRTISHNETQSDRKQRLDHFCTQFGLKHRILSIWRKSSNEYKGKHRYCSTKNCPILVDDKHKFMFCFVQKIASTSVKKLFSILRENNTNESPIANITAFHMTANDELTRISPMFYSTNQNKQYLKAIFVRHPFIRLVSAFKDKAEKNRSEEPFFYAKYWDRVMRLERGQHSVDNQSRPLFSEFVKLVLNSKIYELDEHWAPIWTRCEPCYVEYDIIGKLETPDDWSLLQSRIRPPVKWKRTIWENTSHNKSRDTIRNEIKQYFLQISAKQIIDLYKLYFLDFQLFGYSIEEIFW